MYATLPHLQTAIRTSLNKGGLCRVYEDTLSACWPHEQEERRFEKVSQFAQQNHWAVTFRRIGALGLAAEFHKADESAQAA